MQDQKDKMIEVQSKRLQHVLRSAFSGEISEVAAELTQNAARAGARGVFLTLEGPEEEPTSLVVSNDGEAPTDPMAFVVPHRSGWAASVEEAERPMGLGFFSLLYHENCAEVEVHSAAPDPWLLRVNCGALREEAEDFWSVSRLVNCTPGGTEPGKMTIVVYGTPNFLKNLHRELQHDPGTGLRRGEISGILPSNRSAGGWEPVPPGRRGVWAELQEQALAELATGWGRILAGPFGRGGWGSGIHLVWFGQKIYVESGMYQLLPAEMFGSREAELWILVEGPGSPFRPMSPSRRGLQKNRATVEALKAVTAWCYENSRLLLEALGAPVQAAFRQALVEEHQAGRPGRERIAEGLCRTPVPVAAAGSGGKALEWVEDPGSVVWARANEVRMTTSPEVRSSHPKRSFGKPAISDLAESLPDLPKVYIPAKLQRRVFSPALRVAGAELRPVGEGARAAVVRIDETAYYQGAARHGWRVALRGQAGDLAVVPVQSLRMDSQRARRLLMTAPGREAAAAAIQAAYYYNDYVCGRILDGLFPQEKEQ